MFKDFPRNVIGMKETESVKKLNRCKVVYGLLEQFAKDAGKMRGISRLEVVKHLRDDQCPKCCQRFLQLTANIN